MKEHDATCSANMVVNTFNIGDSKSLREKDLGTKKAMVVWVDGTKKGEIDGAIVSLEQVGGHIFDPLNAVIDGPLSLNWVLQKI